MKEIGILFTAEMVRAILDGRKTLTSRLIKPQPKPEPARATLWHGDEWVWESNSGKIGIFHPAKFKCRWQPGDVLIGRETWKTYERPEDGMDGVVFRADGTFQPIENTEEASELWGAAHANGKHGDHWRPGIHMPYWAARIRRPIVRVWANRLQDMTEEMAVQEGDLMHIPDCQFFGTWKCGYNHVYNSAGESIDGEPICDCGDFSMVEIYAALWDRINPKHPWASNPWVWRIEFERIK